MEAKDTKMGYSEIWEGLKGLSTTNMKATEIAWCAGFFDGEGCISRPNNGKYIQLRIAQKNPDALYRFSKVFGGGNFYHNDIVTPSNKPTELTTYILFGSDAIKALSTMLSYLTVKRAQAIKAIEERGNIRHRSKNNTTQT